MTTPEPTDEHIDAVARAMAYPGRVTYRHREFAHALLNTDDLLTHQAQAANLPREVMLASLVADGTLTEESDYDCLDGGSDGHRHVQKRRLVTSWEAQP